MSSMKPAKAWVSVESDGRISECTGYPVLFANKAEAARAPLNGWGVRPLRVRIIDDAAVERVIAAMRRVLGVTIEGSADIIAAIRDLGGKP